MKKLFKNLFHKDDCTATFKIGKPKNLTATGTDNDGFAVFNLYDNNDVVLRGLDITQYTVDYFESEETAKANTNPLEDAWNYYNMRPYKEVLYVRVTDKANPTSFSTDSFTIAIMTEKHVNTYELTF